MNSHNLREDVLVWLLLLLSDLSTSLISSTCSGRLLPFNLSSIGKLAFPVSGANF